MSPLDCSEVLTNLSAYLDGQLDDDESRAVETHLAQCEECTAELDELWEVNMALGELEMEEPPRRLWNMVLARLGLPSGRTANARTTLRFVVAHPLRLAGAVAVVLFIAVAASLGRKMAQQTQPSQQRGRPFDLSQEDDWSQWTATAWPGLLRALQKTPEPKATDREVDRGHQTSGLDEHWPDDGRFV